MIQSKYKKLFAICAFSIALPFSEIIAQKSFLQSGPMLGYSEMREVLIWVQTNQQAEVFIEYWDKSKSDLKFRTNQKTTLKSEAFTAKLIADNLEPGIKYEYALYINNQKIDFDYPLSFQSQKLWQFRTDAPDIKIAAGSCFYVNEEQYDRPGKPYGKAYEIVSAIYKQKPDAMLWLGDNTYMREADWTSQSGIFHRYTHTRSLPELQALLASTNNYATWDDHDYGPNDSDRGFRNKDLTRKTFELFWGNQKFGENGEAIYSVQSFSDVDIFMLDDRWFRSPNNQKREAKEYLGEKQLNWLMDNLLASKATFKLICVGGQVLNPIEKFENYSTYPEERQKLLRMIEQENIQGVFFLSGDRHFSELTKIDRYKNYPLYDLTVSALTAGGNDKAYDEPNINRVSGTCISEHNFAILEIQGKKDDRVLKVTMYDKDGKEIWTRSFGQKELETKK